MSLDLEVSPAAPVAKNRSRRVDEAELAREVPGFDARRWAMPALAVMAVGLVLVGAGNLDVGPADAKVGMAANEPFGAMALVCGSTLAPELWPARVGATVIASLFEEWGRANSAAVLWPAALAAVAIGWLLARRMMNTLGTRAGLCFGLCWLGCVGVIDHSAGTGLDFICGLAIVAALDRLLSRGSDWIAGFWAAFGLLAGGWPPVLLLFLAVIVIGRKEAGFSPRLLIPPALAALAWSIWALATAPAEAWAAALTLPLTERPSWGLGLEVLAASLPLGPLAVLAISRPLRERWSGPGRPMMAGWVQASLACVVAGTIVPGLAQAARVPVLAGLLMTAGLGLDAAWSRGLTQKAGRACLGVTLGLLLVWLMCVMYGSYVSLLVFPYYRPVGIAVLLLSLPAFVLGWLSMESGNTRRAMVALALLALCVKLVHWGYYVPEWNYRHGQGPWGRAIGQWVLPNWPLYTFHDWPADLALATSRPVRQLRTPQHLAYPVTSEAHHVLLQESEFENWPATAPRLIKVTTFQDNHGETRVLARTEGVLLTPTGRIFSKDDPP